MSKKFQTYCRIGDYIETIEPELHSVMQGLCVLDTLNSRKSNKGGTTFLLPTDKKWREDLAKYAYSSDVNEAQKAVNMLNAHIIRDVFRSPAEWMSKDKYLANSLFPSQRVDIKGVAGTAEVEFENGSKAKLDPAFKDSSRNKNLAVWKIDKPLPVTDNKPAPVKQVVKPKRGGYADLSEFSQQQRSQIAIAVENEYKLWCAAGAGTSVTVPHHTFTLRADTSPYEAAIFSLLKFLLTDPNCKQALYCAIPTLTWGKIDFYTLVEPHNNTGNYLLDDSIIAAWWKHRIAHTDANAADICKQIDALVASPPADAPQCAYYHNRAKMFSEIRAARHRVLELSGAQPRKVLEFISEIYKTLAVDNKIGNCADVYPAALHQYYAADPLRKLAHDELRFISCTAFEELRARWSAGAFNELANIIGEAMYTRSGKTEYHNVKLLNAKTFPVLIAPNETLAEIRLFVNSTCWLHQHMTAAEYESMTEKCTNCKPAPGSVWLFTPERANYQRHNRLADLPNSNQLITMLEALDVNSLPANVKAALARKFGTAHGVTEHDDK